MLIIWTSQLIATSKLQKIIAVATFNNNNKLQLTKIEINNFAEKDLIWYTGKDGFYQTANLNQIIEIYKENSTCFIEFIRTGKEKIKKIANLQFTGTRLDGSKKRFYLKDIQSIKFTSAKTDKICEVGHIWRNTDFIYCPYDGTLLKPYEENK